MAQIKRLKRIFSFTEEYEHFRELVRDFVEKEIVPHHEKWEKEKIVLREIWEKAGSLGLLCPSFPVEYGRSGTDFLYSVCY